MKYMLLMVAPYEAWKTFSTFPMEALQRHMDFMHELNRALEGHHRLAAVRAHLLERAGEHEAAVASYRSAAERTDSLPERRYLVARAARLATPH